MEENDLPANKKARNGKTDGRRTPESPSLMEIVQNKQQTRITTTPITSRDTFRTNTNDFGSAASSSSMLQESQDFDDFNFVDESIALTSPQESNRRYNMQYAANEIGEQLNEMSYNAKDHDQAFADALKGCNEAKDGDEFDVRNAFNAIMKGICVIAAQGKENRQDISKNQYCLRMMNENFCKPNAQTLPRMMQFLEEYDEKKKKPRQRMPRLENPNLDWSDECKGYYVTINGEEHLLRKLKRVQVFKEVLRFQNEVWVDRAPEIKKNGRNRNLKTLIQKYLYNFFARIDDPRLCGLAVSQFLWPHDFFIKNHMSAFETTKNKRKRSAPISTARGAKSEVASEEKLLFCRIMLYIGGNLYCRQPETYEDVWSRLLNLTRENINHRGNASNPGIHVKPIKIRRYIPDMEPIMTRNIENDEEWKDAEEELRNPYEMFCDMLCNPTVESNEKNNTGIVEEQAEAAEK